MNRPFTHASMAAWLALAAQAASAQAERVAAVPLGTAIAAPFTDLHWQKKRLGDFGRRSAFVVYFATVECPIVGRTLPGLGDLARDYLARDVVTLVMNVGGGDAFVDAAAQVTVNAPEAYFAKDFDFAFAKACGVDRTNTVVVLDREHKLRYRGRVDDQHTYTASRERPLQSELRAALDDVLAGRAVSVSETAASGCRLSPLPEPDPSKTPTYERDVSPIFERTCLHCHRRDPMGGVSLAGPADRKKHAAMIAEVVANGRMPPWLDATPAGTFVNRRSLSLAERETVRAWVAGGMPAGEGPGRLPHPMELPWRIGEVQAVIDVPRPIEVPATGTMPYEYLVLSQEFPVETWVAAIDVRSQFPRALHHCNLAIIPAGHEFSPTHIVANFTSHGAAFGMAPGSALRIPAGSVIALQAYYSPIGRALVDRLQVGLRFPPQPIQQELRLARFGNVAFEVPAQVAAHRVEASMTIPADGEGVSVFVHMHARGRDVMLVADPPVGASETLLIIPAYQFGAQDTYVWAPGKRWFAKGTTIRAVAHYDNSAWNPRNPDPSQRVRVGPKLADEQLQVVLVWRARGEDLQIVVDGRNGRPHEASESRPVGK